MEGIYFLILAFLTAISSIKLSTYGDSLSKNTKLGSVFIGGLLIASITSLPEFVTSISAVVIDNPSLSFGDILGSNMFNIFILSVYNLILFKRSVFKNTSSKFIFECLILLFEYIIILIATYFTKVDICTLLLFMMYGVYLIKVMKDKNEESTEKSNIKYPLIKFIVCSIALVILSILLTLSADRITHLYPNISSSTVGAILLGITTSLPEVVSTLTLIQINNNNMAISNILGSNIFNFLVLALSDIFVKNTDIYHYSNKYIYMYLYGGIFITLLLMLSIFKKFKNKNISVFISLIMSLSYLLVWYFQFN